MVFFHRKSPAKCSERPGARKDNFPPLPPGGLHCQHHPRRANAHTHDRDSHRISPTEEFPLTCRLCSPTSLLHSSTSTEMQKPFALVYLFLYNYKCTTIAGLENHLSSALCFSHRCSHNKARPLATPALPTHEA